MFFVFNFFIIPIAAACIFRLIVRKPIKPSFELLFSFILSIALFNTAAIIPAAIAENRYNIILTADKPLYSAVAVAVALLFTAAVLLLSKHISAGSAVAEKDAAAETIIVPSILALVGIVFIFTCLWMRANYNVSLREIIFTVTNSLDGANTSVVGDALRDCLPFAVPLFVLVVICFAIVKQNRISYLLNIKIFSRSLNIRAGHRINLLVGAAILLTGVLALNHQYNILGYIRTSMQTTEIYEEYYVSPDSVKIEAGSEKRNLIYIYLESMETTYASFDEGGAHSTNYIPNLTQLAKEEINFTEDGLLGGFHNTIGSEWTMGSLFSTTAGIPFSFPTSSAGTDGFALGTTSLYDILDSDGYNQYFLCGSDADFGGRKSYYQDHGDITIYDLNTARSEGTVADDYYVWWGLEDAKLYEIAKDKILQAAADSEPFSFTMLTVDTHFPDGYVCGLCGSEYSETAANVVSCADRQVYDFISWCRQQDFYENTSIVVMGDHPRMDLALVEGVADSDRTAYCCFVNCNAPAGLETKRLYTQLDIFPTILHTLGYSIENDRLGLGTNLFSGTATLAEQLGLDYLNAEFQKSSSFYTDNFM